MVTKTSSGFEVRAESGRRLGGPYKSKSKAIRRLKQVEWFKAHKPTKK